MTLSQGLKASRDLGLAAGAHRAEGGAKPLAFDLCCGLGGWTEGLLSEGYDVIGYDIEEHVYGDERYPARLVLQDVLSLNGADLAAADLIVASPPCQAYSYMAMPWSLAKAKAAAIRADESGKLLAELNAIFDACFRIQREASAAAGRYIPMVVENVRGAQPWVGPAQWSYGSYYLWGDIPALMPNVLKATKVPGLKDGRFPAGGLAQGHIDIGDGRKNPGFRFDGSGKSFQSESVNRHVDVAEGRKGAGAGAEWFDQNLCKLSSGSNARKAASAKIAKIPLALSSHIARVYLPRKAAA